jgi:RNA polymerase II elongation factor ELL
MATTLLPPGGVALVGAPDRDLTQEIVDELLESVRNGKAPQIFFGKTPVCDLAPPEACYVMPDC